MSVHNKVAVITGASGGLGEAYAHQLAASGYSLLISGRQQARLVELAMHVSTTYGTAVEVLQADLSDEDGITLLTDRIKVMGRIDMLVSNAGYGEGSRFEDESVTDVMKMISVHINATVRLVHAVLPIMKKQQAGDIITVSSLSAFVPAPGSSVYASTKTFLNTFMESIQMEVRRYGIRVQSLCPGLTHTGFHSRLAQGATPLKGLSLWMSPEDVVTASLKKLGGTSVVYVPGFKNKLIRFFTAIMLRSVYLAVVERVSNRLRSLENTPPPKTCWMQQ